MAKTKKESAEEPIEKQLWKAADKLRKNIDAAEYKHIVLLNMSDGGGEMVRDGRWQYGAPLVPSAMAWACPASNAGGSGFPLQVLGRNTGLRAFRSNPSREMQHSVSNLATQC